METLKKLAVRLRVIAETQTAGRTCQHLIGIADTLDAYIKAQESAEPVACGLEWTKPNLPGLGGARHWECNACGYAGDHDANPGCKRAAPPPREPIAWWDGDKSDPSLSFTGPTKFETIPLFVGPTARESITREALESELGQPYEGEDCAWCLTELFAALRALGIEVKP